MKYNVVAINDESGKIIGVQEYDSTNDSGRDGRRAVAVAIIAGRLGINPPHIPLRNREVVVDGISWGVMAGDIQIGMEEISWGKWGFTV